MLITSKTVGGTTLHAEADCLSREDALRLYTHGSAWFSREENQKGTLETGQLADLAVLSDDYFAIDADAIRGWRVC